MIGLERVPHPEQRAEARARCESRLWNGEKLPCRSHQSVRRSGRRNSEQKPSAIRSRGPGKFDGPAVRRVSVCVRPRFPAGEQSVGIGQLLRRNHTLERGQPMFVVAGPVVGFASVGGGLEFVRQCRRPLFPREVPLFGQLDRHREGLCLPWLGKHRTVRISKTMGQGRERQ